MDSALPTAYALRGKRRRKEKKKRKKEGIIVQNNTRDTPKFSNS
jgi:hypothetical protein